MADQLPKSANKNFFKPRTPGKAAGALFGATAMSVIAGVLVTAALTPVVALTGAGASTAISLFENLPDHINPSQLSQPSTIWVTKDGQDILLARFYAQNRQMVGWDQISQYAKDAAVSEEDPRFYSHGGVDVLAASRAVVQRAAATGRSGASTITMQYVRNILIQEAEMIPDKKKREAAYLEATREQMDRKLKEMRLAVSVEKNYSKNDILLGYLNIANYGGQVYGIQAAAKAYYSKDAKDLTIAEAASLVGIVNSPANLSLSKEANIPANKQRRDKIINSMLREGKITKKQRDEAIATPVEPKLSTTPTGCTMADANYGLGHFCDYVVKYLTTDKTFGKTPQERWFRFQNGGLKIKTTIDLDLQEAAFTATRNTPAVVAGMDYGNASVALENRTGRVLAMVQNRPFNDDEEFLQAHPDHTSINYNTENEHGGSSGFQYGSVVKAFTLAEWLRTGHSVNDVVNTSGRSVNLNTFSGSCLGGVYGSGPWSFQNHSPIGGNHPVLYAMDQSLNGGFISMAQKMDMCGIFKLAEDMGIKRAVKNPNKGDKTYGTRKLNVVPSGVFNGNDEVAPITVASAYAGFSSEGMVCTPVPIDSITGPNNEQIKFTGSDCRQAIQPAIANGTVYALQHYITSGLGSAGRSPSGIPRMGKTGTTDNFKDDWWVGGTTKVTVATWNGSVTGEADLTRRGLYRNSQNIWTKILNRADTKYGGDAFAKPDQSALTKKEETVPDVTGRSAEEAQQILTAAGFSPKIDPTPEDSAQPAGKVSRTDPAGGSKTAAGSDITIYLSTGKKPGNTVPTGLVGLTAQQAADALGQAGFTNIFMQCTSGANPTTHAVVESVTPAPGSSVEATTRITLMVGC